MERTTLGKTGLQISRLGVGLAEIGSLDAASAGEVLNAALDGGINFLDTAACYGNSEDCCCVSTIALERTSATSPCWVTQPCWKAC